MSDRFPAVWTTTLSTARRLVLFKLPSADLRKVVNVPWLASRGPYHTSRVTCNALIAPQLIRAFELIRSEGLDKYILTYEGCYVPRNVRGGRVISAHWQAIAIDFNAQRNPLGQEPADWGEEGTLKPLVGVMWACGFGWGGHWKRRPDGMHFEAVRVVPPSELPKVRQGV